MEQGSDQKKPTLIRRRRLPQMAAEPRTNGVVAVKRHREFYYFQVHFQPRPGARKNHLSAVQPKLTERLHDMVRRGTLLIAGGYPTSIGGMWLLKVKSKAEAERLVLDNPAVACSLVTYRLVELQDPLGIVIHQEREATLDSPPPQPAPAGAQDE